MTKPRLIFFVSCHKCEGKKKKKINDPAAIINNK